MKKLTILSVLCAAVYVLFGCKTVASSAPKPVVPDKIIDNTFAADIKNSSAFTVHIDNTTVAQGQMVKHSFPLHEADLYDGWSVTYIIPLTQSVFYEHKEKIQITDGQKTVTVKSPEKMPDESYIILKNNAKHSIQLTNGSGTIFPCCLTGKINNINTESVYSIAPNQCAVLDFSKMTNRAVSFDKTNYSLTEHIDYRQGFVYTYSFDGKRIVKEDERPLLKMHEPLWKTADNRTVLISKIISDSNAEHFYAIGKEKKRDADKNEYYAAYLHCITASGVEKWTKHFEEKNTDSSLYDAVVLDDGLAAVGQHTGDEHSGIVLLYSQDGTLLQSKKIDKSSVIQRIIKMSGGNYFLTGFDSNGTPFFATAAFENNSIQYKPVQITLPLNINEEITGIIPAYNPDSKTLFLFCNMMNAETGEDSPSVLYTVMESGGTEKGSLQNKIKSIAAVALDKNGIFYIGGETSVRENSAALVLRFDYTNKKQAAAYTGGAPYSYISSLTVNEKTNELIIGGTERAADSFGNSGMPFLKSFDTVSSKELWTRLYTGQNYELLLSFTACTDYGFIAVFGNVNEDGEYDSPFCIQRTNAVGKESEE